MFLIVTEVERASLSLKKLRPGDEKLWPILASKFMRS